MVGKTEAIVTTVKSILKTLECPICLELLKVPVSVGCGHFFCRQCISDLLQSTYRAPCPICKRSLTRRSIQEASQRQRVISAAGVLAETCTKLTGVNLFSHNVPAKEPDKSDNVVPDLPKKLSSNQENQDKKTRKRKSCDNEENEKSAAQENVSDQNKDGSPSKRISLDSEGSSGGDLPSIDDVFRQMSSSEQANSSTSKKADVEKLFFPPERIINMKTYLKVRMRKNSKAAQSSTTTKMSEEISNQEVEHVNKKELVIPLRRVNVEEENNKFNALKNKTNKVNTDPHDTQKEKASMKTKSLIENVAEKTEIGVKSKENALSPSRKLKLKKKCHIKLQSNSEVNETNMEVDNDSREVANKKCADSSSKNTSKNESLVSNQVSQVPEDKNDAEDDSKKSVEDPFKAIGLNDTAVSVDCVKSPLTTTRSISMHKSPGWSRVKKVKKDFKMRKFTSLHVEKNSPSVTLKNTSVSDPETTSNSSKLDRCLNSDVKNNNDDQSCSKLEDVAVAEPVSLPHEDCGNVTSDTTVAHQVNQQITKSSEIHASEQADQSSCLGVSHEMVCTTDGQETIVKSVEKNAVNTNTFGKVIEETIVPSANVTSSSMTSAKISEDLYKNSHQNILKPQKYFYTSLNKISSPNNISKYAIEKDNFNVGKKLFYDNVAEVRQSIENVNLNVGKKLFYDNLAEVRQGPFPLSSNIEDYQNFQAQNEDFQYVEQSQQTSQVFNMDFQNPLRDNLRVMMPFPCPPVEKTKVIKRTCLTLEEIQDCFAKSNLNGSSETLYSVPFLSGQYKLHVGVADETLNVSILKVINQNDESTVTANAVSLLSDKCIQASNSLFLPPEVVPSSNAGSESSQPDTVDPFPYLSKKSSDCEVPDLRTDFSNKTVLEEATYKKKSENIPQEVIPSNCKSVKDDVTVSEVYPQDVRNYNENEDMNMSEIVHFPSVPSKKDNLLQEDLNPTELEDCEQTHQNPIAASEPHNLHAPEVSKQKYLSLNEDISFKTGPMDCDSSDEEESFRKLKLCVQKEPSVSGKKQSRLSLKKKSPFRRIKKPESSDESDPETSTHTKVPYVGAEVDVMVSKPDGSPKLSHVVDNFKSPKLLDRTQDGKKGMCISAVSEMPSTLASSMLSEDPSETNASDIILEIEDLSDKIKYLEEKLLLCDNGEDEKLNKSSSSIIEGTPQKSDSEDSTDLFPQSVPPTPPNF